MGKKVGVVSLGCPKNLVDSEIMLGMLKEKGYEFTSDKDEAEVLIVNTCGFIESAQQESVNTILEMAECKKNNCKLLLVTGCLAERYREQITSEIPEVDAVIGTGSFDKIIEVIENSLPEEKTVLCGDLCGVDYLEKNRFLSNRNGFTYLKIAEGCDNCCTYCVIPSLRGRYRSRKMENIVSEARKLVDSGIKELVLVAQDTTLYGLDLYGSKKLVDLIQELSKIDGLKWIRLLYCYPEEIDDRLIQEIKNNSKVCKYLDIPIQHISDKILKSMGRRGNSREIRNLIVRLKSEIPEIIIRTTFIVGFPGEDENDFEMLRNFVKEAEFDRLGVFTYSMEEGTPAFNMDKQVDDNIKNERYNEIMEIQYNITREKNRSRVGQTYDAIVQGVADDGIFYYGRTYAEAPEIDGVVYFTSSEPLEMGEFYKVEILSEDEYDLIGEVKYEST
ncbi:MAG TPA: 30S ribosomal protein S12 methylthiotransferase RimO [Clostridiaceae bacterium]|nr:30S ribosomal protein S12 methylthiotransferase RimO [Clostridiaceae bacterium]